MRQTSRGRLKKGEDRRYLGLYKIPNGSTQGLPNAAARHYFFGDIPFVNQCS